MASDGLWDHLTNEQAVDLVGRWLETHDATKGIEPPDLARAPKAIATRKISERKNPNPAMAYTTTPSADEKYFVVADDNAATHLARNALGGGNEDMLCGMLTPSPPYSRNIRKVKMSYGLPTSLVHTNFACLQRRYYYSSHFLRTR